MDEETKKPEEKAKKAAARIAVVRIRGPNKKSVEKNSTLGMLKLYRKNYCVLLDKTPSIVGMIKKVEDCVTWGEIDDSTIKELKEKRGKKTKIKGKEQLKLFFRLSPPKGGFERKGIKTPFALGGALGYRGEKIKDLVRRML